ncbi:hypothetical protein PK98_15380 [Croceibacterium mercuriale]|uniref:Uncharacterized protein n=1 Tax=Croceibacterium mercuriale TaxID=1572751 RepID=A0A0B2BS01_9SPHN|nr:hypothetical protein [Croceibacterium mercuriale]KHL24151.1 hypothetical protein PK98_15380 [Croceibacterium mercuriale]
MSTSVWQALHAETREWAVRANEEWIADLSPDGRALPQRSPETMVVLFGPTQVGKTTLLLTLLGIAEGAAFDAVQHVLRGGRRQGQSSTATPMRYARSVDDRWRMHRADAPGLTAEQMAEELAIIREQVENGSWQATDPVSLYIPACHFADSDPPVRVAILDLPGIAAANEAERALVTRIAQRHVPAASLILLIGAGSHLGVFEPEKLGQELEELRGWIRSPIRYRLVVTYACSQDSVRRWRDKEASAGRPCDLAALQGLFAQEFARFEMTMPADLPGRIYPLELGNSWAGMAQADDDHYRWAVQVQAAARQSLTDDIRRSCGGERRLRISQEVREQAYWRRDDLWRQWRGTRAAFRTSAQDRAAAIAKAQADSARWQRRFERYDARLRRLDGVEALIAGTVRRFVRDASVAAQSVSPAAGQSQQQLLKGRKPVPATVSALQEWLADDQARLTAACDRITEWFTGETGVTITPVELPACAQVRQVRTLLKDYGMDAYWTWVTSQFEADSNALAHAADAQRKLLMEQVPGFLLAQLQAGRQLPQARRRIARQQRDLSEARIEQQEAALAALRKERRAAWELHGSRLKPIRQDLARVARFEAHMSHALAGEARRVAALVDAAVCDKQPAMALARLCQLRLSRTIHQTYCTGTA